MRIVVAIHDPPVWEIPTAQVKRIAETLSGDEVRHVESEARRLAAIEQADVLFGYRIRRTEATAAHHLKWIHSPAAGVGSLLRPELVERDVVITNSRGVHSETVAEHAVALLLALRRGLHAAVRRQTAREWAQGEVGALCGRPLSRTHLLVVGLGTIGRRVARLASSLGMRVTGVRRHDGRRAPAGVDRVLSLSALDDGLRVADAVILAVPSTPETQHLIGARELALLKPSALVVNVARGDVVDEPALVEALAAGRLGGAGLDVFQQEPLPADHPLWGLPNVLVSPHIAGLSDDYWTPVIDLFLTNVERFKRGEGLLNVVDKSAGY